MTITEKLAHARRHVESILRHDDEPLADREKAAAALAAHLDAELKAAAARETPGLLAKRAADREVLAAKAALDAAKAKARKAARN